MEGIMPLQFQVLVRKCTDGAPINSAKFHQFQEQLYPLQFIYSTWILLKSSEYSLLLFIITRLFVGVITLVASVITLHNNWNALNLMMIHKRTNYY